MKPETEKKHVVGVIVEGQRLFYAVDNQCTGYPYFTPYIDCAERLTIEAARDVITDLRRPNIDTGHLNNLLMMNVLNNKDATSLFKEGNPIIVEAEIYKIALRVVDSFEFIAQSNVKERKDLAHMPVKKTINPEPQPIKHSMEFGRDEIINLLRMAYPEIPEDCIVRGYDEEPYRRYRGEEDRRGLTVSWEEPIK